MAHHAYRVVMRAGSEGSFRKAATSLTEDALTSLGFATGHVFYTMNVVFLYFQTTREQDEQDVEPLRALAQSPKAKRFHDALVEHGVYDPDHPEKNRLRLACAPRDALTTGTSSTGGGAP